MSRASLTTLNQTKLLCLLNISLITVCPPVFYDLNLFPSVTGYKFYTLNPETAVATQISSFINETDTYLLLHSECFYVFDMNEICWILQQCFAQRHHRVPHWIQGCLRTRRNWFGRNRYILINIL